ncbi:MAG: carboxymuconolactone decarboxylase family protein [Thermodesulfobacteriota bacterium]
MPPRKMNITICRRTVILLIPLWLIGLACLVTPARTADTADSGQKISKSGIPYRPDNAQAGPEDLVNAIRARRPGGKLLNLDRMLLHSPAFARGWNTMFAAIRGQLALSPKLRELAIMAIGVLNKAHYEWVQHETEFLAAGGTKAQMEALKDVSSAVKNAKLFDESERATLALTYEMTRNITVKKSTMVRVRSILPDQQVVELVGTIAGYNMVSRFLVATGIEVEE